MPVERALVGPVLVDLLVELKLPVFALGLEGGQGVDGEVRDPGDQVVLAVHLGQVAPLDDLALAAPSDYHSLFAFKFFTRFSIIPSTASCDLVDSPPAEGCTCGCTPN